MGRTVDGTSSILYASRIVCRMVGKFGTARFALRTTPAFAAAVEALVTACMAFEALDDYPGQIDSSGPIRPGEDTGPS